MVEDYDVLNKKLLTDEELSGLRKDVEETKKYTKAAGYTNDEHIKKQKDNSEKLAHIRGGIINSIVELEHLLCMFLSYYFAGSEKCIEFYENVLAKDFFTMSQKIKLFQRIGYHDQERYHGKYEQMSKIMTRLNEIRNLVAHGTNFNYVRPEIGFPYSGKSTHFDDNLAKMFGEAFEQVWFSLYLLEKDLLEELFEKENIKTRKS